MKKIIFIVFVALLLFTSCSKDKNNYSYSDIEQITVSGLEGKYSVISLKDTLKISPIAKSNKAGELEYRWGIYETNVQGRPEPLDTIGKSLNLNYFITQNAKDWVLVFMVKNKKTGYQHYKTAIVNVNTQFTRGWYVLKDDENTSDLDLFITGEDNLVNEKIENAYSMANDHKIEGQGNFISFTEKYKSNILNPSAYANTRTLLLATTKDIQAININTLKKIRNKQDIFLSGSESVSGVTGAFVGSAAQYAINNGQLYNIYAMSANSGQFGNKIKIDSKNTPYELSKFMAVNASVDPILFDNVSGSFVTLGNGSGATLTKLTNMDGNEISTTNNHHKALFIGFKSNIYLPDPIWGYKTQGYAILQDQKNPAQKSLCYLEKFEFTLITKKEAIDPASKLYNASLHTLLVDDENLLYFVHDNQVYSRNLSNGFEQLQYNVPGGEQVTFIKHIKYEEDDHAFNYVIIGTKMGSAYKIRMFHKKSGNIIATPIETLEGQGTARSLIYITPDVYEYSYVWSY